MSLIIFVALASVMTFFDVLHAELLLLILALSIFVLLICLSNFALLVATDVCFFFLFITLYVEDLSTIV